MFSRVGRALLRKGRQKLDAQSRAVSSTREAGSGRYGVFNLHDYRLDALTFKGFNLKPSPSGTGGNFSDGTSSPEAERQTYRLPLP